MKERKEIKTGNGTYTFVNETLSTRNGFAHETQLFIEGLSWPISTARVNYLNRTWELYRYQTSMMKAVRKLIDERKGTITADIADLEGWGKITAKRREKLDQVFAEDETLREYKELEAKL
jgi:hypothetical protein